MSGAIAEGTRFVLESPIVYSDSPFCLNFWYHRHGDTIGPLYVEDYSKSLLKIEGNSGNEWYRGQIDFPAGIHKVLMVYFKDKLISLYIKILCYMILTILMR